MYLLHVSLTLFPSFMSLRAFFHLSPRSLSFLSYSLFFSSCIELFHTSLVCPKEKFFITTFYFIYFFSQTLSCYSLLCTQWSQEFSPSCIHFLPRSSSCHSPLPIMYAHEENCPACIKELPLRLFSFSSVLNKGKFV